MRNACRATPGAHFLRAAHVLPALAGTFGASRGNTMLDSYSRTCPRCAAPLSQRSLRCPSCHKLLPRRLAPIRRLVENCVLGTMLAAVSFVLIAPELARELVGERRVAAAVAAPPIWKGAGPEPAARRWAVQLEESLEAVCHSTFASYADFKSVKTQLAQVLPAGLLLTAEEEKEAADLLSEERRFSAACLRWSYEALSACERYRENLSSTSAMDCLQSVVERALTTAPFDDCASTAKQPRLQRACALAAERLRKARR
jgi:hypothetical protein